MALDSLDVAERDTLLKALNIDMDSLMMKSVQDFRNLYHSDEASLTLHQHHKQRLVLNYKKIKDFMQRSQKRQGRGNSCLYLSREGNRLLDVYKGIS